MADHDDAAKYAALAEELNQADAAEGIDREPISLGGTPAEADSYDPAAHGVPEPQHQPQQPQYHPSGLRKLPDDHPALDDPVGYFNDKVQQLESQGHQQEFWGTVQRHEARAREEVPDYDQACEHLEAGRVAELERQFPDNHQTALLAHAHGCQSPAHLRAAILNRDRAMVAQWAMQNGLDPAATYYKLAQERGYKSPVVLGKSQRRQLASAIERANDSGDYAAFDKLWDTYAKVARTEDERARYR